MRRSFIVGLATIGVLAGLVTGTGGAFGAGGGTGIIAPHGHHHGLDGIHHTHISWEERDRAVYVVSTLNAPLCSGGKQLSTELWQDGARTFVVLKSSVDPNLYYVKVRLASRATLGVYAYAFGWKLPRGVQAGECVRPAPAELDVLYRAHAVTFVARFHTTFPR